MLLFLFALFFVVMINNQTKGSNAFFTDYSSPAQTTAINGIFVLLVFLSHAAQYVKLNGVMDKPYDLLKTFLGQLVVVTFLFFSGYGMMESIRKKGKAYVKNIPGGRLFKVWYHFAIAVLFYIILNLSLGRSYSVKTTLLAFTGWSSISNSNWYMFVTFVLYIIVFISFVVFGKSNVFAAVAVTVLTAAFAVFEYKIGLPSRFYNTIICFPAGMLFSLFKPYFDKFVLKRDFNWLVSFVILLAAFGVTAYFNNKSVLIYSAEGIIFVFLIMLFTMKVKIQNGILNWFGKHVFSIYILQRIPMEILEHFGIAEYKYLFVAVSFAATVAFAAVFDKCTEKMDTLIYRKKKI